MALNVDFAAFIKGGEQSGERGVLSDKGEATYSFPHSFSAADAEVTGFACMHTHISAYLFPLLV